MKLKLNPTFSTTRITNNINSKISLDLSFRKIQNIHVFRSEASFEQTLCLTVKHPIQDGSTTYFLKGDDIKKVLDYAKANEIAVTHS